MNLCSNQICTSCHAQPYESLLSQFIDNDVNLLRRCINLGHMATETKSILRRYDSGGNFLFL